MLVSLSLGAQAQTQPQDTTMNRTVVVEQEYNPDIMDASKVNVLPRVVRRQPADCGIFRNYQRHCFIFVKDRYPLTFSDSRKR